MLRFLKNCAALPPIQYAIYLAVRFVLAGVQMLPRSAILPAGRIIGCLLGHIAVKPIANARRNLEKCPSIVPPGKIRAFMDRVFENLGIGLVELLRVPRELTKSSIARFVRLERFDIFDQALKRGKGVIAVIGHMGNYELGGLGVCLAGYPLQSVARPMANPWLNRYLTSIRERTGQKILPSDNAVNGMLQALRKNGIVCIQPDLDAKEAGILVDFLGRPASVHPSIAVLALRLGTPMVMVNAFREGAMNVVRLSEPIEPAPYRGKADAIPELTKEITRRFEEIVREHPHQWMWVLDRWRSADRRSGERRA